MGATQIDPHGRYFRVNDYRVGSDPAPQQLSIQAFGFARLAFPGVTPVAHCNARLNAVAE